MRLTRATVAAATMLALGLLVAPGGAPAEERRRFAAELGVREAEVLVEIPPRIDNRAIPPPQPGDLMLLEGGEYRVITEVAPVTAAGDPFELVLYFDRVLASPGTVRRAALALAGEAATLAALGEVSILVADPRPEVRLRSSRAPLRLAEELAAVAAGGRDHGQGRGEPIAGSALPISTAEVRRQSDRLLLELATSGGPRALFLPADDFSPSPPAGTPDAGATPGGHLTALERILGETGRLLGAYGWTTVALPLRPPAPEERTPAGETFESWHDGLSPDSGMQVPTLRFPFRKRQSLAISEGAMEAFLLPQLAPVRALAQPTGGTTLRSAAQLPVGLARLGDRYRVAYQVAPIPDGELRPLEVSIRGWRLQAPAWTRSGTPTGLAEARLRELLAGRSFDGGLALSAAFSAALAGQQRELLVHLPGHQKPAPSAAGPLRASLAHRAASGELVFRHELLRNADADLRISLAPADAAAAVLVEDLASGRWGAAVLAN